MLLIKELSKSIKRTEILHGINIEFENGVYGLLGENGAGKTTLMRCIANLYNDYRGTISCDSDIIGYLPQSFDGLDELTVEELLLYFSHMKGLNKKQISNEINTVLEKVNLADKKKMKMNSLSGGMRRRVGIAQTLLGSPKLIMYDEPTTGLDPKERIRFQNIIAENKRKDSITIISTHIVSDIEYLSDRIIVLKEGNLLGNFLPTELAKQADGKVYELSEAEYERVKSDVMLIKISQDVNEKIVRVISDKRIIGKKVNSTVEDGYLWVSR